MKANARIYGDGKMEGNRPCQRSNSCDQHSLLGCELPNWGLTRSITTIEGISHARRVHSSTLGCVLCNVYAGMCTHTTHIDVNITIPHKQVRNTRTKHLILSSPSVVQ